jgi:uncharacterized short protein YbdD (DUF466 family)
VIDLAGGYDDYLEQLQSRKPERTSQMPTKHLAPESPPKRYPGSQRNCNSNQMNYGNFRDLHNKENESPGTWGKSKPYIGSNKVDPR